MGALLRARLLAFLTHFISSGLILCLFSLIVYFVWYPDPYHIIYSTWDVIKILIVVDVALGPAMTLMLFDIRKPAIELKRDISIIVLIQAIALFWGGYITYKVRPLVAAYYEGEFYTLTREDFEPIRDHAIFPAIHEKPELIYVRPFDDKVERKEFFLKRLSLEERSLVFQPSHYVDIEPYYEQINIKGRQNLEWITNDPMKLQKLNAFIEEHAGNVEDYCYHQIQNGSFIGVLVMDCKQPVIIGLLN